MFFPRYEPACHSGKPERLLLLLLCKIRYHTIEDGKDKTESQRPPESIYLKTGDEIIHQ